MKNSRRQVDRLEAAFSRLTMDAKQRAESIRRTEEMLNRLIRDPSAIKREAAWDLIRWIGQQNLATATSAREKQNSKQQIDQANQKLEELRPLVEEERRSFS